MSAAITAAVGAAVVGGALQNKAASKASKAQRQQAQNEIELQRETRDISLANLAPFLNEGRAALPGLADLARQQLDPAQFYGDYFGGQEYAQLSDQARRNILAGAEATGGLRTTSTANTLGSIAPQLAQSAFARQQALQDAAYNRQMGLVNVGLNAAGAGNAAAGNAANQIGGAYRNLGAINAGGAAAPYQAASGVVNMLGGALSSYLGNRNAPNYAGAQQGVNNLVNRSGLF